MWMALSKALALPERISSLTLSVTLRRRLALNHEQVNRPARVRRLEFA
jgi:hypothetical protein